MMRRGFTMLELLMAIVLLGGITAVTAMTFSVITNGWQTSTEYMDKMQRADYGLDQVVSALRSLYYPHDGEQSYDYGFILQDNGEGDDPDSSDVIEWSKMGAAIVGNRNAIADTVHRVQVMILEEGDSNWKEEIQVTGLYARLCNDVALTPKDEEEDAPDEGYGFGNSELYQPVLIADGIVGFNCRVLPSDEGIDDGENDRRKFEDEFQASNSVPYKVELTFRIADPEGKSYRSNTAPLMRIVRIPLYEQSKDGAKPAGAEEKGDPRRGGSSNRPGAGTGNRPGAGGANRPGAGGGARPGGGAAPGGAAIGGGGAPPPGGMAP
jgi:prepilin-type N-terminal cleavage/methylation domain-containing protein